MASGEYRVSIRLFGILRSQLTESGGPRVFEVDIAREGMSAHDLAESLGLAVETVEGVFVNQTLLGLDAHVEPGDRVAFVPFGTPGPHRVYLGLYEAGKHRG